MKKAINIKFRFNLITTMIYIVGIVLLFQLFNLQIVHGGEYREKSDSRLTRESILQATRGNILDKTGNAIASNSMGFSVELYKTKIDTASLNETVLNIVKVLESNGDKYVDSFPININPYAYTISDEKLAKFKKDNKIAEDATPEVAFNAIKEKYEITTDNVDDARKIMAIRYEITQKGYSSTRAITLSENTSRASAMIFNEQNSNFPGVNIVVEPIRSYVSGELASHIVGNIGRVEQKELDENPDKYSSNDVVGKNGIEYVFQDYLKGENGTKQIDMTVDGTVTEEYVTKEATKGSDVVLTIDANLQKVTEEALASNIQKIAAGGFGKQYNAGAGAAVVMNVKTGEILSMASYPTFNPQEFVGGINNDTWNSYNNNSNKPLRDKAVQDAYAPGSIFKMVSAIAGLETGAVSTTEKINDTGVYPKYTKPVCWYWTDYHRGHGWLNVSDAIKHSCNYFFYEIGDRMGIDNLEKYSRYFGLGEKTGIELPNETSGTVASKSAKAAKTNGEKWYSGETLSAVIGQSYNSFSPLQMTKYISMVANGGKQIHPSIVKTIIKADGSEVPKTEIEKSVNEKLGLGDNNQEDLNIKQENIQAVLEGMRSVTSETGGTAYNIFKDFNIEVGGKTGSAEAPGNKVNAWFAGFAPFNEPEIAVVVFVENGGHGNYTAEAVRDIMAQYFGMNANKVQENMSATPYTEITR